MGFVDEFRLFRDEGILIAGEHAIFLKPLAKILRPDPIEWKIPPNGDPPSSSNPSDKPLRQFENPKCDSENNSTNY